MKTKGNAEGATRNQIRVLRIMYQAWEEKRFLMGEEIESLSGCGASTISALVRKRWITQRPSPHRITGEGARVYLLAKQRGEI
jgi:hypothetical protein